MSLIKPSIKTPFHIDFDWWKQNERDWHVFLRSLLCTEHQEAFADVEEGQRGPYRQYQQRQRLLGNDRNGRVAHRL